MVLIWESTVFSKAGTKRVYRAEADTVDEASAKFRAGDTLEETTIEYERHTPPRRAWTRKIIWETIREAMAFRDGVCWARDDNLAVWIEEEKPCEVLIWVDGDDPDHPVVTRVDVVGHLPPKQWPGGQFSTGMPRFNKTNTDCVEEQNRLHDAEQALTAHQMDRLRDLLLGLAATDAGR